MKRKTTFKIKCKQCGNKAKMKSSRALYCSSVCRQRAYEKRHGIPSFVAPKVPSTKYDKLEKKYKKLKAKYNQLRDK